MSILLLFPAADSTSTSRVDYFSLSQQTLMETLVQDLAISAVKHFQDNDRQFHEIFHWYGLIFKPNDDLKEVRWSHMYLGGEIHVEWLPSTVEKFKANGNSLRGTLHLSDLYRTSLKIFEILENKLTGSADLSHLPDQLEILSLADNKFYGSVDLAHLPDALTEINLRDNEFSGTLDLTRFPATMRFIGLSKNFFEGSVDVTSLPARLYSIYLNENRLTGSLELLNLPTSLNWLDMGGNAFTGDVVMSGPHSHGLRINLRSTQVTRVVDLNGNKITGSVLLLDKTAEQD